MKHLLDIHDRASRLIFGPMTVALVIVFFAITASSYRAQVPEPPLPVDPRPLTQLISESEKALLSDSQNPKRIVEAYLKISETHLQAAFNAIRVSNESAAERELDTYNKAVAAAGKEAFSLQDGKRGVSKKVEQVLYKQIKTLERIEKLFSNERERFAEAALKHAKQLRVQALNEAFASGDVLKDPESPKEPNSNPQNKDESSKDPTIKPPLARRVKNSAPARLITSKFSLLDPHPNSEIASSQIPGDYLTEEEDEHVREAQAPDARVKVFMRIADRRLKALTAPGAPPTDKKEIKRIEEEEREWGAVPKVSRVELLQHYARAISECMTKLEDAYEHNPKSAVLPKALALLRDATDKQLQMLNALKAEMKTESEIGAMSGALGEAETANKGARDGLK